jgi:hypothetical protein
MIRIELARGGLGERFPVKAQATNVLAGLFSTAFLFRFEIRRELFQFDRILSRV